MIRVVATAMVLFTFLACGNGPKRTPPSYVIKSSVVDPSRGAITISIAVDSQASEADVKAAAEDLIGKHRADFPSITVKSDPMSGGSGGLPYGTSIFADGVISHSFNPQGAREKIKTH